MIGKNNLKIPKINQIQNQTPIYNNFNNNNNNETEIKQEKNFGFVTRDSTKEDLTHKPYTKEILFINKKVGRRKKNLYGINNNHHSKKSKDNIIRKIRIHAIRFGLDLINDCIKFELKRQSHKLRMINRTITSNITIEMNLKFINLTLGEIYQNSPNKTHNCTNDTNIKQIKKLKERKNEAPRTNELLDMTFSNIYDLFINGDKNELKLKYGLNKARTFKDFLDSMDYNEDKAYIEELKYNGEHFIEFFMKTKSRKKKDDDVKEKKKIFKSFNNTTD